MITIENLYENETSKAYSANDLFPMYGGVGIFVSSYNTISCLGGILFDTDDTEKLELRTWNYYDEPTKKTKKYKEQIKAYLRIKYGRIYLDYGYKSIFKTEEKFKKLNYEIQLPSSNFETFYSVNENGVYGNQNDDIVREAFGLTMNELDELISLWSQIVGMDCYYEKFPKLTKSIKCNNYCDITGLWIPKSFPYIKLDDNLYTHVSLYGFYKYIASSVFGYPPSRLANIFKDNLSTKTYEYLKNIIYDIPITGKNITDTYLSYYR